MNYNHLNRLFKEKKFCDAELLIKDDDIEITISAHKTILSQCKYFDTLFSFENNIGKNQFIIEVPNARIINDIIKSFYGIKEKTIKYPKWKYVLLECQCKNYLLLPINPSDLYDLQVPTEGFELLLIVADLFDDFTKNAQLMISIRKNLPSDYDLSVLSKEFAILLKKQLIVSGSTCIGDSKELYGPSIIIWNADTGEPIQKIYSGQTNVNSVKFSRDNKLILSSGSDNSIKLWKTETGDLIRTLNGHSKSVISAVFTSDNQLIVSGSKDCKIKIWKTESGECVNTISTNGFHIYSIALSSDDKLIAVADRSFHISIYDTITGQLINKLEKQTNDVGYVAFANNDNIIVFGNKNNTIMLWDLATCKLINSINFII